MQNDQADLRRRMIALADRFGVVEARIGGMESRMSGIEERMDLLVERMGKQEANTSLALHRLSGIEATLATILAKLP